MVPVAESAIDERTEPATDDCTELLGGRGDFVFLNEVLELIVPVAELATDDRREPAIDGGPEMAGFEGHGLRDSTGETERESSIGTSDSDVSDQFLGDSQQ
jgi:hypothetical protein